MPLMKRNRKSQNKLIHRKSCFHSDRRVGNGPPVFCFALFFRGIEWSARRAKENNPPIYQWVPFGALAPVPPGTKEMQGKFYSLGWAFLPSLMGLASLLVQLTAQFLGHILPP